MVLTWLAVAVGAVLVIALLIWLAGRQRTPTVCPGDTVVCPHCGNSQTVPDVVYITEDVIAEYGRYAQKCERCRKLWSPPKRSVSR